MKVTISSDDTLDRVIAVVEALYDVRLQQVGDGGGAAPGRDAQVSLPEEEEQGATKPRHG
ncbi:hypothetical protein N866_00660 [Actinotalea ferrariae CF5-4]|uniref:Uncharacterized protein n=1 Tax=Actinotalea ferrariae CF5-4 TaxID=948458 RepID=A0A021VY80_9CELL|nr:hypothetical protein [Actinotalea ferrariae]EYR64960.1 hypothetical protein N866_00660 [Actinotalea ferrariae CF5-4]